MFINPTVVPFAETHCPFGRIGSYTLIFFLEGLAFGESGYWTASRRFLTLSQTLIYDLVVEITQSPVGREVCRNYGLESSTGMICACYDDTDNNKFISFCKLPVDGI